MSQTVDLVVTGNYNAALGAAVGAVRRGRRVLVVLRSGDARATRRFHRDFRRAASGENNQLTVITSAEVVCVDGIDRVEAVVIRRARTGSLCAVNASKFCRSKIENEGDFLWLGVRDDFRNWLVTAA